MNIPQGSGQNYSRTYGVFGKEELELQQYAQDTEAAAVVMFDFGKSYFEEVGNTFEVIFERTTRIKIFSEAGIPWAEVEIPYYQEGQIKERVMDIEASAYNVENGEWVRTQLNASNAYDEKINNSWTSRKFAIPGVKEGTIIEYKYKIRSQYKFTLRDWEFQWRIPVVYSEYEIRMVPVYEYSFLFQGGSKFDFNLSYEDRSHPRQFDPAISGTIGQVYYEMVHKYGMKDVPAFIEEPFISSGNDYIMKIDFQLSRVVRVDGTSTDIVATWELLVKELLENPAFGEDVRKSERLAQGVIQSLQLSQGTQTEKFNLILDLVKRTYNWDKQDAIYASKPPARLMAEKYGNAADINLFTIGLLRQAGIDAYPVLISTRENGKIKYDYPYTHFFDYVIILARLDGQPVLSDATEPLLLNDRIPPRCINDKGLVIKEGTIEWVSLECSFISEINTALAITLSPELELKGDIDVAAYEYDALEYRINLSDDKKKIRDEFEVREFPMDMDSISMEYLVERDMPYNLHYVLNGKPEVVFDKIYVTPFLGMTTSENPLKQEARTYAIDMNFPTKRSYISTIAIPDGYHLDFKPEDRRISNPMFEFNYSVASTEKEVIVTFDYTFTRDIYPASEYPKLKAYFNGIVKKGNEKIVFSR